MGSPPLTRELQPCIFIVCQKYGITPAYAGTTTWQRVKSALDWDHPRLRGNYMETVTSFSASLGSPPLTRELRELKKEKEVQTGITPAYAGTTEHFQIHLY